MKNRTFAFAAMSAMLLAGCAGNRQQTASPTPAPHITKTALAMAKRTPKGPGPAVNRTQPPVPLHAAKHIAATPATRTSVKPAKVLQKPLATPAARAIHKTAPTAKPTRKPTPKPTPKPALAPTPVPTSVPPAISFTTAQAGAGKTVYGQSCAACHGATLQGGNGPALAGSGAQLLGRLHTAGSFFTSMSTRMPLTAPGSLSHEQYVDIMAFILEHNGYHASGTALTFGAAQSSGAPLPASP